MKRFKEFKNNIQDLHEEKLLSDPEYYAECLLEQVEESGNSPFGGDELPASPSGQDLWSKGLEGASGNSRPKYWKNFIKIVREPESDTKTKFMVMTSDKKHIEAYVSLNDETKANDMEEFLTSKGVSLESSDKELEKVLVKKEIQTYFEKKWGKDLLWDCIVLHDSGDTITGGKVSLKKLNKSAIKGLAFQTLTFKLSNSDQEEIIKGEATGSNIYTSLYEQAASISILPRYKKEVKEIVNFNLQGLKAVESKELFDLVYGLLQKGRTEIGGSPDKISKEIVAFYFGDVLDIIQGSYNFSTSVDYKEYFRYGQVLHGNIEEYYKKYREMETVDGSKVARPGLKKNTADSVYMTFRGNLQQFSRKKLKEESATTGEIGIYDEDQKVGTLLQLSLKKSKEGAQGGKVLRSLTYFGFYDKKLRQDVLDDMEVSLEHTLDHMDLLYLQEGLLQSIVDLGKKGMEYAKKQISKMVSAVTAWAKSIISRMFSVKAANKIHKDLMREITKKYNLTEALTPAEFLGSKDGKVNRFWNEFREDYNSMIDSVDSLNNSLTEGKFSVEVGPSIENLINAKNKEGLIDKLDSKVSDLRFLVSNRTTFRVVENMMKQIQTSGGKENVDSMAFAIDAMSSLSDDIKMGESELPVIKLYGTKYKGNIKAWEVVSRKGSQDRMTQGIKSYPSPIDLGFISMDQESRGKGYLVTYLYLLSGVNEDGPYYTKAQLTSDNKTYKAETTAGYFDREKKKIK